MDVVAELRKIFLPFQEGDRVTDTKYGDGIIVKVRDVHLVDVRYCGEEGIILTRSTHDLTKKGE